MRRSFCTCLVALSACAPVDLFFGSADAGDAGFDAGIDAGRPCGGCGDGGVLVCDADAGLCVECTVDAQCPHDRPACEPVTHVCVECVSAAQCDAGQSCAVEINRCGLSCSSHFDCDDEGCGVDGICRDCDSEGDCGGVPAGPHCDLGSGRCGECNADVACTSPTRPVCDRARSACVQCVTQTDCDAGLLCDPVARRCVGR